MKWIDKKDFTIRQLIWLGIFAVDFILLKIYFPDFVSKVLLKTIGAFVIYESLAIFFCGVALRTIAPMKWTIVDTDHPEYDKLKDMERHGRYIVIGCIILGVHILAGLLFYVAQFSP